MWKMCRQFSVPQQRGLSALVPCLLEQLCSLERAAETTGSGLVPVGLLTGKSTREMILRAATNSAPAQAAGPASCARKTTSSWVVAVVFLNGSFSGLCRKFEAFHNSHLFMIFFYLAAPLILPPQWDPNAADSWKSVLLSALVESNQETTWLEQPWAAMWHQLGHFALQEQWPSRCSPAARQRVISTLSRNLVTSMSHHGVNKDVWWDRTVAIWARAVLRLLFCSCSSLLRSPGYTTRGVRSIGNAAPSCPSWAHGPACASVLRESALQTSHFKYLFKAIGSGAFKWNPTEVSQNH